MLYPQFKQFRALPYVDATGRARHHLIDVATGRLSTAGGLYAAYLSQQYSPNTVRNQLNQLSHLFSHGEAVGLPVEQRLLRGEGFEPREVRGFVEDLKGYRDTAGERLKTGTVQAVLTSCRRTSVFFLEQFHMPGGDLQTRRERLAAARAYEIASWEGATPRGGTAPLSTAPDLTTEQVEAIENHLLPESRVAAGEREEVAHRDYLIWLLTFRMGMRIGEVLALRLEDCPTGPNGVLRIVRVEDRGQAYRDPRAPHAPRPKTLGRELRVLDRVPVLPQVIAQYTSQHHYHRVRRGSVTVRGWNHDHPFLILDHTSGQPLSCQGAQYVAARVARCVGFPFHWHLARHAFFNRYYKEIATKDNFNALLTDMCYWGGWSDERSHSIYIRSALRERACELRREQQSRLGQ